MRYLCFDSSTLVKVYLDEPGSEPVRQWIADDSVRAFTSGLAFPETISAVARAEAGMRVSTLDARRLFQRIEQDFAGPVPRYQRLEPAWTILSRAADLARRHRLRGFDAVHLATALELRDLAPRGTAVEFAATDTRLVAAAGAEGLPLLTL